MTLASVLLGSGTVVAGGLVFLALERRYPYNPGQRTLREGFWLDVLAYGVVQSVVLGFVIAALLAGLERASGGPLGGGLGAWPVPLQVAFFVVTHDLYIYLFHRLQHRSRRLWRLHEAHHSLEAVDAVGGARSHAFEILINQTIEFAPIVLLGAAPETAMWKGIVSGLWGMFIHANLDVRLGRLQYLINGPEMHRWHHSRHPLARGRNFSTKLALWDWALGTAFFPDRRRMKAADYGLGPDGAGFPRTWLGQNLAAFRPEARPRPPGAVAA